MEIIKKDLKFKSLSKRGKTTAIILHHSAGEPLSVEDIHRMHQGRGWSGIGYHFFVRLNGEIYQGRPIDMLGAHASNNNSYSIGICFEGNYEQRKQMPQAQFSAGRELIAYIQNRYGNKLKILGHRDVMATACPGKYFPFDEMRATEGMVEINPATIKTKTPDGATGEMHPLSKDVIVAKPTIVIGARTNQVAILQDNLNEVIDAGLECDGIFGAKTYNALRTFQLKCRLKVDGVYGKKSAERMKELLTAVN